MGKKKAVLLGKFSFESQSAYEHHCRHILDTQSWGKALEGDRREFALEVLLSGRPYVDPSEIAYLTVDDDGFRSRCFYAAWVDDRERQHFTYKLNDSATQRLKLAMRFAVKPQIRQLCAKPGYDVHHEERRFDTIATEWLNLMKGLGFETIELTDGEGNEYGRNIASPVMKDVWANYHRMHATLVVLSKEEHKQVHSGF